MGAFSIKIADGTRRPLPILVVRVGTHGLSAHAKDLGSRYKGRIPFDNVNFESLHGDW